MTDESSPATIPGLEPDDDEKRRKAEKKARRRARRAAEEGEGETKKGSEKKSRPPPAAPEKKGIRWLPLCMLIFMFGPAIFGAILVGSEWLSARAGLSTGPDPDDPLNNPYRAQLVAFYNEYAPEKATTHNLNKVLRKYKGREKKLFRKLERKYLQGEQGKRSGRSREPEEEPNPYENAYED